MNYRNNYAIKLTGQLQTRSHMELNPGKAIIAASTLIVASTISFVIWLTATYLFSDELFSVSNPLKSINTLVNELDQKDFITRLSRNEKYLLANKVQFVSSVIGRANRKVDHQDLALSIVSESTRAQVDPLYIAAIVKSESAFKVGAVSHKGARGLMQLMPETARFTQQNLMKAESSWFPQRTNLHSADYNLSLGITYIKHLEEEFAGNRELALIAYNWGPGNLKNALRNKTRIPEETRIYARKILLNHKKWKDELRIVSNLTASPRRG